MFHEGDKMKKKIAITGGIGSGKSLILSILKKEGFACFSCDAIYDELIEDVAYIEKVKIAFPGVVFDGVIDRKCLSAIVFSSESQRLKLNALAHTSIMNKLHEKMDKEKGNLVFAEVPLLFEGDYQNQFDGVIVVVRDKEERIQSVQNRDGLTREEVLRRMNAQFDHQSFFDSDKKNEEHIYFIKNNGTIEQLEKQVTAIVKHFS